VKWAGLVCWLPVSVACSSRVDTATGVEDRADAGHPDASADSGVEDRADAGHPDASVDSGVQNRADAGRPGSGADAGRSPACPESPPHDGAPCAAPASCEWAGPGGSGCSTVATCSSRGSTWSLEQPSPGCGTAPLPCPAAFDTLPSGSPCPSAIASACDYPDGRCGCVSCGAPGGDGGDLLPRDVWACRQWDRVEAQPSPASPGAHRAVRLQATRARRLTPSATTRSIARAPSASAHASSATTGTGRRASRSSTVATSRAARSGKSSVKCSMPGERRTTALSRKDMRHIGARIPECFARSHRR
jgi:hypothetical protein